MEVSYPAWAFWFSVFQFVFNIALAFAVWWSNREKVTTKRFGQLEGRMAGMETKIAALPVCGNHQRMEDNDTRLFQRLDSLHGDIRELVGGVKGLTNSLELINQHLLTGGK